MDQDELYDPTTEDWSLTSVLSKATAVGSTFTKKKKKCNVKFCFPPTSFGKRTDYRIATFTYVTNIDISVQGRIKMLENIKSISAQVLNITRDSREHL